MTITHDEKIYKTLQDPISQITRLMTVSFMTGFLKLVTIIVNFNEIISETVNKVGIASTINWWGIKFRLNL